MTDRELLQQLFNFLKARRFVAGDEASVRDMVRRYKQPPLTIHYRAAMQLTVADYQQLGSLLEAVKIHLEEASPEPV